MKWETLASTKAIEKEMPFEKRLEAKTIYSLLSRTAMKYSGRPAVCFAVSYKQMNQPPNESL